MTKKIQSNAVVDMPSDTIQVPLKKQVLAKIKQLKAELGAIEKLVNSMKEASTGVANPGKGKGKGAGA